MNSCLVSSQLSLCFGLHWGNLHPSGCGICFRGIEDQRKECPIGRVQVIIRLFLCFPGLNCMCCDTVWTCLSPISVRRVLSRCRVRRMISVVRLAFMLTLLVSARMSCLAVDVGDQVSFEKDGEVHSGEVARTNNGMVFVFHEVGGRKLPHAVRIEELLRTAITLNTQPLIWPTNRYLVSPTGLMVDLSSGFVVWKYDGIGDTELENLSGAVQQAGYRIDDAAPATLAVEMGRSKTTNESYIVIGPSDSGGNQFTVRYSGFYTKAEIRKDNETIWKASFGSGMGKPSYKPRKEPYDYVEQPHKNTLKNFPLPKRVLAAKYESGFGSSRITPRGIE